MTPHRLHALAALHSLRAARDVLADYADAEAKQIAAERLEAPSVLRSTVYGGRFGSGGHSDPTPAACAVAERPARRNRWAEMAQRLDGKLGRIADMFAAGDGPGLDRIHAALPDMTAARVYWLTRHLADEERWVREAIGQPRPTAHLPGECRGCGQRSLLVQTAGPQEAWTVVCAGSWEDGVHNPCLCVGVGCACGMPGGVEGVAHIWWRGDVLRAVAGAAPTKTNN